MELFQIVLTLALLDLLLDVTYAVGHQNNGGKVIGNNEGGLKQNATPNGDHWIEQRLNHFDALDRRTWMQRYIEADYFYQIGGPGILYVGGESSFPNFRIKSRRLVIRMAERIHGKLFHLDHRYYGKSHPTNDTSVDNLRYLTSEQALVDIANFIQNISALPENVNITKWILVGASYSGSLAVWTKLKYPHLVYGVVALSPPLKAKPFFGEYMESVNQTLRRYGGMNCYQAIGGASHQIVEYTKTTEGRKKLRKLFNLCNDLTSKPEDMWIFHSAVNNNIENVVQFSMNNVLVEEPREVYVTIKQMCQIMTSSSIVSEIRRFAHLVRLKRNSSECMDISFDRFVEAFSNSTWSRESATRAWYYQACTEFGWFQTAKGFPFLTVPKSLHKKLCTGLFSPRLKPEDVITGAKQTNSNYGGIAAVTSLTRTILYNGGVDPWHVISHWKPNVYLTSLNGLHTSNDGTPDSQIFYSDPYGFSSIFVDSGSHAEAMRRDTAKDSNELRRARSAILELVAFWVDGDRKSGSASRKTELRPSNK